MSSIETGSSATSSDRVQDDRARDHRPLLLAAREIGRVLVHELLRRAPARRCSSASATRRCSSAPLAIPWIRSGCPTDCLDRHRRVQGRMRILEDDLHPPPVVAQLALAQLRDVAALEHDAALGRPDEAQQRPAERRLAAARLADEPQHLALAEVERDVVDCLDLAGLAPEESLAEAAPDRVVRLQPADRDESRAVLRAAVRLSGLIGHRRPPRDSSGRRRSPGGICSAKGRAASTPRAGRDRAATQPGPRRRRRPSRRGSADGNGTRGVGRSGSGALPGIECSSIVSSEIVERRSSRVYGCAGSANTSRAGPSSTIRPAYITATRSQASAMIPRLCVISRSAVPKFALQVGEDPQDLRLDDHVERRSSARPRPGASDAARARARS